MHSLFKNSSTMKVFIWSFILVAFLHGCVIYQTNAKTHVSFLNHLFHCLVHISICKVMDQIITRGYRTSMEKWFFQDKLNMVISSFYAKSLIHYHIWWLGELGKKWRKILFNNLPKPFLLYNSGAEHLFHSRVYYSQLSLLLIWDKKNGQAIQAGE